MSLTRLLANNNYIVLSRDIVRGFGLEAALMLGELCQRQNQHGEWFWATNEQLEDSTGLSAHLIRKAVSVLREAGIVQVVAKGLPRKNHYRVDESSLAKFLEQVANDTNGKSLNSLTTTSSFGSQHINNDKLITKTNNEEREGGASAAQEKRKRFSPPTRDEVADYCEERGNGIDPDRFVAYYESNGWRVGRNPMKDWRAAVRTWEQRDAGNAPKKPDKGRKITIEELMRIPIIEGREHAQALLDENGVRSTARFWIDRGWGQYVDGEGE